MSEILRAEGLEKRFEKKGVLSGFPWVDVSGIGTP
jgi:hypothetical protein